MFYLTLISSNYSKWITTELVKLIFCCFITILSWKLNVVLDQVLHFTCRAFDQLGQPPTRILNFLFDSFSEYWHEIMEVQWFPLETSRSISYADRCFIILHSISATLVSVNSSLSYLVSSLIPDLLLTFINLLLSVLLGRASTSYVHVSLRFLPDLVL